MTDKDTEQCRMLAEAADLPERIKIVLVGHSVLHALYLKERLIALGVSAARITALGASQRDNVRGRTCRVFIDVFAADKMSPDELTAWRHQSQLCDRYKRAS